jgi:integrase
MRYRELFCVFPRRLNSGRRVYYYQTYDPQGRRTNSKSTGAVKACDARMYCMKLYREGTLGVHTDKVPTMEEYSLGWWNMQTCEYLKSRMARRKISSSYARHGRRNLEKNILPTFRIKRLDQISSHDVDVWMLSFLDQGKSAKTVNLMLTILKIMLGHAVKKGFIKRNPCDGVERVMVTKKRMEILTPDEVRSIFDPTKLKRLWGKELHYVLNLLGATTGLRIGEVLGLKGTFLFTDYLEVSWQYNNFREYTETKTHETRYVTIPTGVARGLFRLKELNGDGYLFSKDGGKTPLSRTTVYKHFHKALAELGSPREEQTRRGLNFHKWRHFYNTTLRMGNVADSKVRELTGHKSEIMTEHYTHFDPRRFDDVKKIQESIARCEPVST